MRTLAGAKLRRFRETQRPVLTRAAFAERYAGLTPAALHGLEERGKVTRNTTLMNKLAEDGICDHADWYQPAPVEQAEAA